MNIRCFVTFITMFGLASLIGCMKKPKTLNEQATTMALDIVSNSVIAPTTVKFSNVVCEEKKDHVFFVSGNIDSQNSYGAMLRKVWLCILTNSPQGLIWLGTTIDGSASVNTNFK